MREIIKIENLSKIYKRKNRHGGKTVTEDFWALRDLSLSINQGDVLGVIGKNGAGKSTLLKILSKITSPTDGKITINGRVGSLLEVGTGFHHEMTGRENIYMNGNILGMSNAEIRRKIDEIVDFSGIGDFLEMPVKRYSSGMQTRLAFAVAAHLEPEILIIDEVLAVGDAEFQKKCMRKMEGIGNSGRTIIFVSHNTNAVKALCNRCVWLRDGVKVQDSRETNEVVKQYLKEIVPTNASTIWENNTNNIEHSEIVEFLTFKVIDENGQLTAPNLHGDDKAYVEVKFKARSINLDLQIGFALYDSSMNLIFMSYHNDSSNMQQIRFSGENHLKTRLPLEILNDGEYTLQLIAGVRGSHPILSRTDSNVTIAVSLSGNYRRSNVWDVKRPSMIAPILNWECQ